MFGSDERSSPNVPCCVGEYFFPLKKSFGFMGEKKNLRHGAIPQEQWHVQLVRTPVWDQTLGFCSHLFSMFFGALARTGCLLRSRSIRGRIHAVQC